jgi:hypothetical protein
VFGCAGLLMPGRIRFLIPALESNETFSNPQPATGYTNGICQPLKNAAIYSKKGVPFRQPHTFKTAEVKLQPMCCILLLLTLNEKNTVCPDRQP